MSAPQKSGHWNLTDRVRQFRAHVGLPDWPGRSRKRTFGGAVLEVVAHYARQGWCYVMIIVNPLSATRATQADGKGWRMTSDGKLINVATGADWLALKEAVAEGRLSMMDIIKNNQPGAGDYFGHVQSTRAFMMLMQDERILRQLSAEIGVTIDRLSEGKKTGGLNAAIASKDGLRNIDKMTKLRGEMAASNPSLLNGSTFEECLQQYLKVVGHLEQLWTDSTHLYRRGHYPLSAFTAILLIEEMGKIGFIGHELMTYDSPRSTVKDLNGIGRNHRQKIFMGVVGGALVNARLDRILGLSAVRKAIQDAESGKLEEIRQSCLYVDYVNGAVTTPAERIGQEQAKFFVLLAGEIWAEIYGHFPFEFERMIELVSAFEIELGYTYEQINGTSRES